LRLANAAQSAIEKSPALTAPSSAAGLPPGFQVIGMDLALFVSWTFTTFEFIGRFPINSAIYDARHM
jgi:hypothetical protein